MRGIVHFIQYNNAVPIVLGALFLGASATFAMVNPEVIYTEDTQVLSIDNTYIAEKSLDDYTPEVRITNVTEDEEYYYVEYKLTTIMLEGGVWQDVEQAKTLKVSKLDLGEYRDLGLYVSAQLKQLIDREVAYLKEVQAFEKANVTQKVVSKKYGGLIGSLLDDTTEELPGYTPVVQEKKGEVNALLAASRENAKEDAESQVSSPSSGGQSTPVSNSPIQFQILGNNPARIPRGARYSDLGVIVVENKKIVDYTVQVFLGGKEVSAVDIDTSSDANYTITYKTKNAKGDSAETNRVVIVGEGGEEEIIVEEQGTVEILEEETEEEVAEEEVAETEDEVATTTEEAVTPEEEVAEETEEEITEETTEEEVVAEEEVATTTEEVITPEEETAEEVVEEPTVEETATTTSETNTEE